MQPILGEVMARRRNRAIAIVLGVKEREADNYLPTQVSDKLRKAILDQFNEYHDFCQDIMRSLDTGDAVLNEEYVNRLERKLDRVLEAVG